MGELILQRATARHLNEIVALSRNTFRDSFGDANTEEDMNKYLDDHFNSDTLRNELNDENNIFLLALDQETDMLMGYAKMRNGDEYPEFKQQPAIEIERIYAIKDAIGKGIGKFLMQGCIGVAESKQRKIIWLGVWEKNERAIKFYERAGFEKFGEHDFVLGTDVQRDWLMKKNL